MLERTLAVLDALARSSHFNPPHEALPERLQSTLEGALNGRPLVPPAPVDPRVDMLFLVLDAEQAKWLASVFEDTRGLVSLVRLDAVQAQRKNPWGGFREAWLEHYNQQITDGATKAQGSLEMAETEVQSEVAGTVWKVHVAAGDAVSKDQELMILESMKMEIPVDAPCAGTVASVLVAPEEGIEEDQVLLIIES